MSSLTWSVIPYQRPLPRPIVTSHGTYADREGFLLCVRGRDELCGLGDVAPLRGFSRETLELARAQWETLISCVKDVDIPENAKALSDISASIVQGHNCCSSLLFGLESALADLAAKRADLPLARWLNPDATAEIEVNALLHAREVNQLREQAIAQADRGFRTFKIKAGSCTVAEDTDRASAVRDAVPGARIRVDVNAAWNVSQFHEAGNRLSGLDLEFVEQPLPVGEAQKARQIANKFSMPLALDEEVDSVEKAESLIQRRACDVVVLKPMTVGGLTGCLHLARLALRSHVGVVFTSVWESDVGLAATLHLALACGGVSRAVGLSTAGMIAEGLIRPALRIENARLRISGSPGIGVELV